ncbi:MAG: Rho termination factor N-terminal domain-containing protein [Candidatus Lokiarchaeota archaeon]|nr:Rho termination factor N-terminal domain-containing protein [Candidatus Lokiarchaeota archaeon]
MSRKIDDKKYLSYLLQYPNVNDLKQICRDFNIKGFSKLKKSDLIDFILDSLAEEELKELIEKKELEIINEGIDLALNKISGIDQESISSLKIVNEKEHEVEIGFKGMNWEVISYLSITDENIDDPERDCDCRIGSAMGLCSHFWVGFIFSLKQGWFDLKNWSLTKLPNDFQKKIISIKIKADQEAQDEKEFRLVDESSEESLLSNFVDKSVTIYDGTVEELERKEQDFQGNISIYYIVKLTGARIGPRVQKKSDYKEEAIVEIDALNLRISDKLHDDIDLKKNDRVSGNGKLTKDNFLKMHIVKNVRKLVKL